MLKPAKRQITITIVENSALLSRPNGVSMAIVSVAPVSPLLAALTLDYDDDSLSLDDPQPTASAHTAAGATAAIQRRRTAPPLI
jgi:hypothetical protein